VARVTVHHLTLPKRLPLIEEDGLLTRASLSGLYGPPSELDLAAPGTYAHGKRVTGWLSEDHARDQVATYGAGFVSYTLDPAKTLAAPAERRTQGDPEAYWADAKPLQDWLDAGDPPEDLEVHQNLPVRAKYLQLHAPLFDDADLGEWAPLVAAVADADRLSAKALMHLAVVASDADFDSVDFRAACALAWRDEPDPDSLVRELIETDPDKVVSAALAEHGGAAADLTLRLRQVLDETREWAEENGMDHGQGLFSRTAVILDDLPDHVA
jgi:hypothetical protein